MPMKPCGGAVMPFCIPVTFMPLSARLFAGNLRAAFFRNIWMVEKVRKNFDEDEIEIFRKVYAEGKADGEFDIDSVELVADITHYCIKGLEVPFIYGRLGHGMTPETSKPLVAKVVYGALGRNGASCIKINP